MSNGYSKSPANKIESAAGPLNKSVEMKKLHLKQALRPLEKHLARPVVERLMMAKKRAKQKSKRLSKVVKIHSKVLSMVVLVPKHDS